MNASRSEARQECRGHRSPRQECRGHEGRWGHGTPRQECRGHGECRGYGGGRLASLAIAVVCAVAIGEAFGQVPPLEPAAALVVEPVLEPDGGTGKSFWDRIYDGDDYDNSPGVGITGNVNYTVWGWIYTPAASGGYAALIGNGPGGGGAVGIRINSLGGKFSYVNYGGTSWAVGSGAPTVGWHFFAITRDDANNQRYGVWDGTAYGPNADAGFNIGTDNTTIGALENGTLALVAGSKLAMIGIANTYIPTATILDHRDDPYWQPAGTVLLYGFQPGSGTTLIDASGNGKNGAASGGSATATWGAEHTKLTTGGPQ